jgi:probable F420-dependent oxidoreductase
MHYGVTLPGRGPLATADTLARLTRGAEELDYDMVLAGDHIVVPKGIASPYPYTDDGTFPGAASGEYLEQLTLLAFLAGQTQRIRLVTSVLIVPHRNPLVAAKALATLDVLSKGRLTVGIGVGWMREEFAALGLPPFAERGAVTDEYVQAFKELWTSENPTFTGTYCQFSNITFLPKPLQKPHPPIWVGGESRRAMRRTAQLADGWYPIGSNPQHPLETPVQLAAGIERLAAYARDAGRNPAAIDIIYRTHTYYLGAAVATADTRRPFTGSAAAIAEDIRQYAALGVTHLVLDFTHASRTCDDVLQQMDAFATQVRTQV